MQNSDILYWLATLHMQHVGPATVHKWLRQFGHIKNIYAATQADLVAAKLSLKEIHAIQHPNWSAAEEDLRWAETPNCSIIGYDDPHYPPLLRELSDAPVVLFVRGAVEKLSLPQLAIVGSRHPTPSSQEVAEQFAYMLAKSGLIITSGLACGIDAASHQGALRAQGNTIAVSGTGLNQIYPASNRKLAHLISANGAIISEFSPKMPAIASNFPRRNRIISGLSLGVLVVEAALRSGSLITARFATEQNREVFAVPGSIHNPLARGCHHLIQQGAKLVVNARDILDELKFVPNALNSDMQNSLAPSPDIDEKYRKFLKNIAIEVTALDTIIIRSGLTPGEVSSMLLQLEFQGYVRVVPGGYVRNAYKSCL